MPRPAEKRNGSILQYRIVEKEVMGKSFIDRSITGLFSVLFSSKMELGEKREYSVVLME